MIDLEFSVSKLLSSLLFSSLLYVSVDAHAERQDFSRANCALSPDEVTCPLGFGGSCRNESISWDPKRTKWAVAVRSVEYKFDLPTMTRLGGNSSSFDKVYCTKASSSTNGNASTSGSSGDTILTCRNTATGSSASKPYTADQIKASKTWGDKPIFKVLGKHIHQDSRLQKTMLNSSAKDCNLQWKQWW
jgi:hypothetical protein